MKNCDFTNRQTSRSRERFRAPLCIHFRTGWLVLFVLMQLLPSCTSTVSGDPEFVTGQLLVQMASGVTEDQAMGVIAEFELEMLEYFSYVGIVWVSVPDGEETYWIKILEIHELIESASLIRGKVTLR
jgi:hypothetical protein